MNGTYRQIILIIVLFTIICMAYSMVIPIFNAPDEPFHFEYIQFLGQKKSLPDQTDETRAISTEGFKPPLYYLINAIFLNLFSENKAADIHIHNYKDIVNFCRDPSKGFRSGIYPPLNPKYIKWGQGQERNMFLTTGEDKFPFSGSVRTIHLLRIISILFSVVTVFFIFKTTQLLFPNHKHLALLTASVCAFNPQFIFLSGSLNNDNLIIMFATLSIWLLTKLLINADNSSRLTITLLGVFIGLGLMTKINIAGIVLIAIAGIIYSSLAKGQKRLQNLSCDLIIFLGPIVILSGWYFLRNVFIYGFNDLLGWRLQAIQNPGLVMPARFRALFFKKVFFQRLFTSFWGLFDWLTIPLPNWAYWIYGLISTTGILGLIISLKGKKHTKGIRVCFLLYLAAILICIANLVFLNFTFVSAQARLIFPAIAPICIFIAIGIDRVIRYLTKLPQIKESILAYGFILLLIGLDFYALFWLLYPIYR